MTQLVSSISIGSLSARNADSPASIRETRSRRTSKCRSYGSAPDLPRRYGDPTNPKTQEWAPAAERIRRSHDRGPIVSHRAGRIDPSFAGRRGAGHELFIRVG